MGKGITTLLQIGHVRAAFSYISFQYFLELFFFSSPYYFGIPM